MARERMVTRTVELTVAQVMVVDVTTAKVEVRPFEVSGGLTDHDAILKVLKKHHETDTLKCVSVQSVEVREILYGMPEIDFIKYAKVLPPRKSNDTDTDDETNE